MGSFLPDFDMHEPGGRSLNLLLAFILSFALILSFKFIMELAATAAETAN